MITNNTLKSAMMDLVHFVFSFMLTFICFSVMGCVMFGFKMKGFKDVRDPCLCLEALYFVIMWRVVWRVAWEVEVLSSPRC
jgi:hypothetical protein